MKRVTPREAQALMDQGWTYVDVRSEPEFEQGHPAGRLSVPLMPAGPGGMIPNPDFLAVAEAALPKDKKLVVGCQMGGRSRRDCQLLEQGGWSDIADNAPGWGGTRDPGGRVAEPGWQAEQLPVEKGHPA